MVDWAAGAGAGADAGVAKVAEDVGEPDWLITMSFFQLNGRLRRNTSFN